MAKKSSPKQVTIRTYDVGFGDCFLLTFHYPNSERHVLVDFGSMSLPKKKTITRRYMERIAQEIATDCKGKLHAVVATHRHRDHISGFAMKNGKGPGAIIRALKPNVVVQPWTEDPKAQKDAQEPTRARSRQALYLNTLAQMNEVARHVAQAAASLRGSQFAQLRAQLAVIGMDNIANPDAVENLRTMARNRYVYYGSRSGLESILPGVKVRVLGPPTIRQTSTILKQRSEDPDEFWHLQARFWNRQALTARALDASAEPLFPPEARGRIPWSARWYRYYAMRERAESLLSIVRILDDAMNNTSVILLFEVNDKLLLFPGDAQYENWMYALNQRGVLKKLSGVNVYKVGHHGSLNATPRTLWNSLKHRGSSTKANRLLSLLSTKSGTHGHENRNTEVPRDTLVTALCENSHLLDTQTFQPDELSRAITLDFR